MAIGKTNAQTRAKIYKCVAVDTTAKTWSGCELNQSTGIVSDAVTSGLTYTNTVDLDTGAFYFADGKMAVAPYVADGQHFYAALASARNHAETGEPLTATGTVTYAAHQGIPCAEFNGASRLTTTDVNFTKYLVWAGTKWSASLWVKVTGSAFTAGDGILNVTNPTGTGNANRCIGFYGDATDTSKLIVEATGTKLVSVDFSSYFGQWVHLAMVVDGYSIYAYVNGTRVGTGGKTQNMSSSITQLSIGGWDGVSGVTGGSLTGYVASVRIFDKSLSQAEVTALAEEFTPGA